MKRPIAITGSSIISALGSGIAATASALKEGRSGLAAPPAWFPHATWAGQVAGELPACPKAFAAFDCRQSRLALAVLEGISDPLHKAIGRWGAPRIALLLGTSTGGIAHTEAALDEHRATSRLPDGYSMAKQHNFHAFCQLIKHVTGTCGPAYVVSTACSSSAKVFASAQRMIAADLADAVLVGGVDTLCKTTLFGFHSLGILASERCRPFGEGRKGINLGEGGAFMLLEREGESELRLLGVGETSDAHHMTSPHPEGIAAQSAMKQAIESAGLVPDDVDYINAHGTGTVHNDSAESAATARLFGRRVPVVSTKAFTGHTLGAAGSIEAVIACLSITQGWIPASLGAAPVDPTIEANINLKTRELRCQAVLSNSFGFGGNNASVLFGAAT